mgnify:CR=1 FL=1
MALTVVWTQEAEASLLQIISYLESEWPEDIVRRFVRQVESMVEIIQIQPRLFRASRHQKNLRKAIIHPHIGMVYKIEESRIVIVLLVDHRSTKSSEVFD